MKFGACIFTSCILLIAGEFALVAPEQVTSDEPSWELQIDLRDGSRLIGVPTSQSLASKLTTAGWKSPCTEFVVQSGAKTSQQRALSWATMMCSPEWCGPIRSKCRRCSAA